MLIMYCCTGELWQIEYYQFQLRYEKRDLNVYARDTDR